MAVSATFEFADAGGNAAVAAIAKNFWNTYTVLSFDYILERAVDKTGRPSSKAKINTINVTLRGIKQKMTPFHDWIKDPDKKMSGDIKIYDSTDILSSMTQGVTGTDQILDVDEIVNVPIDMMADNLDMSLDDASNYYSDDVYSEMSHKDLVDCATSKGVTIKPTDTDENIRSKIRTKDEVDKMTIEQINKYCADNNISKGSLSIDELKKAVYDDKVKKKERNDNAMGHLKSTADKYKEKTTNVAKSVAKNVTKKLLESARCITFENAYCVSLREHFENNPKSQGELDKTYPWIIEIGIRPETVKVSGEELLGASVGGTADFRFF